MKSKVIDIDPKLFDYHGVISYPNVDEINLGLNYRLKPLYGNNAVFSKKHYTKTGKFVLGSEYEETINTTGKVKEQADDVIIIEHANVNNIWLDTLYFCEYCFRYTNSRDDLANHINNCYYKHNLPGRYVYIGENYFIKKVSNQTHALFLQCLCLFTKFFLDNKSSFCNIEEFEFYVLYARQVDEEPTLRNKPLGFFSKQIASVSFESLSSIMIIPPYTKRKLGTLLIEFSYAIGIHELTSFNKMILNEDVITTGPEAPLSPFGLSLYLNYWQKIIVIKMMDYKENQNKHKISLIKYLINKTCFEPDNITLTLKSLACIKVSEKLNKKFIDWNVVEKFYQEKNLVNYQPLIKNDELIFHY
ncbi:uncharacterized protein HGUI_01580 [Hanseniaspora guilliermondii]|uniref:histone acetyltransferase n=1 Tax=Hanseniaspora guilliermondii TaxID=56406 RepID=A0A1L0B0Q7_9ASCO|nr:uncharacterized protein HGUI_01580 [Hanseniaspora guilliermondii]